jgi:hypothetical protein
MDNINNKMKQTKTKMKEQIKTLVKLFKDTWLIVLIAALLGTLLLHLLPDVVKNFMDRF